MNNVNWEAVAKEQMRVIHEQKDNFTWEVLSLQSRVQELEFLLKEALPWLNNYEDCHGTPEEVTLLARIIEGKLK